MSETLTAAQAIENIKSAKQFVLENTGQEWLVEVTGKSLDMGIDALREQQAREGGEAQGCEHCKDIPQGCMTEAVMHAAWWDSNSNTDDSIVRENVAMNFCPACSRDLRTKEREDKK